MMEEVRDIRYLQIEAFPAIRVVIDPDRGDVVMNVNRRHNDQMVS
jgi:hypothetical protein